VSHFALADGCGGSPNAERYSNDGTLAQANAQDDPKPKQDTIAGSNEREQGAANDGEHLFNLLGEAIRRPPG
jgi:hypothetical protein